MIIFYNEFLYLNLQIAKVTNFGSKTKQTNFIKIIVINKCIKLNILFCQTDYKCCYLFTFV